MDIQAVFTFNREPLTSNIRLFVNGTALASQWPAEFSDWQIEHIEITSIEDADGDNWPVSLFSREQIKGMKYGLLLAARRKSAMNPTLAANIRSLLNLPAFDAKSDFAG